MYFVTFPLLGYLEYLGLFVFVTVELKYEQE